MIKKMVLYLQALIITTGKMMSHRDSEIENFTI